MRRLLAGLFLLLIMSTGCRKESPSSAPGTVEHPVFKLRVYKSGSVTLEGHEVKLDELAVKFAEIKSVHGIVWYYRESSDAEPHPNAMIVMKAIADAKLPVSFSNKEDFSTVVLPNGSVKPRGNVAPVP